jgi:hypothetical protein
MGIGPFPFSVKLVGVMVSGAAMCSRQINALFGGNVPEIQESRHQPPALRPIGTGSHAVFFEALGYGWSALGFPRRERPRRGKTVVFPEKHKKTRHHQRRFF